MHYSLGSNVIYIYCTNILMVPLLYRKGQYEEAGTSVLFKLLKHEFQMFVDLTYVLNR